MKAQLPTKKIKEAISLVERTVGKNLSLPVLSAIYISVQKNSILFRSTNLSLGVEVTIPADTENTGTFAVEGVLLSQVIHSLPDREKVTLEMKDTTLSITTKNNTLTLKTIPHEDYPTLPKPQKGEQIEIPAEAFIAGIQAVYYSAAVSDIKPEISSVYMYPNGDELICVATDSFRLAEKRVPIKKLPEFPGILIPFKNVSEIIRIIGSLKDTITLSFTKTQLSLEFNGTYITSRLIDGSFPDYQQIIPDEEKTTATVLKQDFQEALKMSQIFTDKFNQITITTDPKEKLFQIAAKNTDIGENTTQVEAALEGEKIEANFNYRYITDCFQSIAKDSITLTFAGENKPLIIRGVSDRSFMYLAMPMNR